MAPRVHIETPRLILRDWTEADAEPFAALNADLRVMEFFPKALTRMESDAQMASIREALARNGFGLYAVKEKDGAGFIGFTGLAVPNLKAAFMPAIEIGWRLARESWGNGYATEAAGAVIDHAFGPLGLDALVSFTAEGNRRSQRVMEKTGMTRDPRDDFLHPKLPADHRLASHVLYRIDRDRWLTR